MRLGIAFQPNLLGVLSQFSQFDATVEKYIATATEKSIRVLAESGQAHMNFMNPTDNLHDSIEVFMVDAYNAETGSNVAYAHRREFSFEGPDSLGRMFPNDPAGLFFTAAINDQETLLEVAQNYIEAVYGAWGELIGNLPSGTLASVGAY